MKNPNTAYLPGALEQMTEAQLEALLKDELEKEQPNGAAVRQILEILDTRDDQNPPEISREAEAAWKHYRAQRENSIESAPGRPRLKASAAIAAILALILLLPQQASAKSIFDRIIHWTDSFFELLNPEDVKSQPEEYIFRTDNPGLQQVYDAVTEMGITDPVVPMWLPEGYELVEIKTESNPSQSKLTADFIYGSATLIYKITLYENAQTNKYYIDGSPVVEKEYNGTIHTIVRNNNLWIIVWTKENTECSMFVDCHEDDLYKIIKSIYTMEEKK